MNRRRLLSRSGLFVLLILPQLACSLPLWGTPTRVPMGTPAPMSTATRAAEPTSTPIPEEATPVALDACSLVTEEEAAAALGGDVERQPPMGMGGCTYATTSSPTLANLTVGAAQREEAKALSLVGAELMLAFSQDEEIREMYQDLRDRMETISLGELVTELASILEAVGMTAQPLEGVGDVAFWISQPDYSLGELLVVRGDTYVYVVFTGVEGDLASARELVEGAFERLPSRFTVMAESTPEPATAATATLAVSPVETSISPTGGPPATPTSTPGAQAGGVTLIAPEAGAVLDNGRSDRTDGIEWAFDWADYPGAIQYHLYVINAVAEIPLVDNETITASSYTHRAPTSYIQEGMYENWTWKVRALVDGQWTAWSEIRVFSVEPVDSDPPSS